MRYKCTLLSPNGVPLPLYIRVCVCVCIVVICSRAHRGLFSSWELQSRGARATRWDFPLSPSLSLSADDFFSLLRVYSCRLARLERERERYNRGDENRRAYRAAEIYIMSESAQEFGKKGRLAK